MRCWSCGLEFPGSLPLIFTCPFCRAVEEQKKIRERLESSAAQGLRAAIEVTGELSKITGELSGVTSILEWGFEEIEWKLHQIRGILGSIEKTLKTPSQTQANEWRQIAEELRRRGVLDESEKFFLKSLETNPLDYRTYIGLGKTYLQMGELKKARSFWEKSLPHAPKGEIDYKSYSYRLIGRLDFCEDNPRQAASRLKTAIELSPNYPDGHYDFAQYSALIGNKQGCLSSLRAAIIGRPAYFYLAQKERNLEPLREEVQHLLTEDLLKEAEERNVVGQFLIMWRKVNARIRDPEYHHLFTRDRCGDGESYYRHFIFMEDLKLRGRRYRRGWDSDGNLCFVEEVLVGKRPTKIKGAIRYEQLGEGKIKETKFEHSPKLYSKVSSKILDYSELNLTIQRLLNPGTEAKIKIREMIEDDKKEIERECRSGRY